MRIATVPEHAWTRRDFLGLTAGATWCPCGWSLGLAADVPSAFDGRSFHRAPETTPKRGGVFRYGVLVLQRTDADRARQPTCVPKAACMAT